jgi:hypothetical protein
MENARIDSTFFIGKPPGGLLYLFKYSEETGEEAKPGSR